MILLSLHSFANAAAAEAREPAGALRPIGGSASRRPKTRAIPAQLLTIAQQAALDRAGFSPGLIDGAIGPKTRLALRAFQRSRGLPVSGAFDARTAAALGIDREPATVTYRVTTADVRQIGPVPTDWNAKSALSRLGYESMAALLAERGHCTKATLSRINGGRNMSRIRAADTVLLPNIETSTDPPRAALIEVDLSRKLIVAKDGRSRVVGLFHCSIAKHPGRRPSGAAAVRTIAHDPEYTFDPRMWPKVRNVRRKLTIPPGPRNPVGVCWIGLSLPGYGIHGTPAPELIGKTGSHGCIRLTNWDAVRLSRMIAVGTPVRFTR